MIVVKKDEDVPTEFVPFTMELTFETEKELREVTKWMGRTDYEIGSKLYQCLTAELDKVRT